MGQEVGLSWVDQAVIGEAAVIGHEVVVRRSEPGLRTQDVPMGGRQLGPRTVAVAVLEGETARAQLQRGGGGGVAAITVEVRAGLLDPPARALPRLGFQVSAAIARLLQQQLVLLL